MEMDDDLKTTLKGKIKILYQLGKWLDVVKLCELYAEKFGKDMEVDLMRHKSNRHLGQTSQPEASPAPETEAAKNPEENPDLLIVPDVPAEEDSPLVLAPETEAAKNPEENPDLLIVPDVPAEEDSPLVLAQENVIAENQEDLVIAKTAADEDPAVTEAIIVNEPAADENKLIITDPFAENEPCFIMTADESPVNFIEESQPENVSVSTEPEQEISFADEKAVDALESEVKIDFKSTPAMEIDAEPELNPAPEGVIWEDTVTTRPRPAEVAEKETKAPEAIEPIPVVTHEMAVEKPEPVVAPEMAVEKPESVIMSRRDALAKTPPIKRIAFNFKLILLPILALVTAVVLWLALSGKLHFGGDAPPSTAISTPVNEAKATPVQRPIKKVFPPQEIPKVDEQEKVFNEKFKQANDLYEQGMILKAWAVVLEAKKIKMTEPLRLLEEKLAKKLLENEAATNQTSPALSPAEQESQVYAKAESENTLAAWQNYIKMYPQGEFVLRARKKIAELEKQALKDTEQQLQQKVRQTQKIKLRSAYESLNQAEIAAMMKQIGKLPDQFEQIEHGGEKVVVDFATGLMWTLWNKPMAYDKAQWWANRLYAGYSGWRLPTAEEALSLLQMEPSRYSGLVDFAVWTGDSPSEQSRSVWVLKLPEGDFIPARNDKAYYVWAVRKIVR